MFSQITYNTRLLFVLGGISPLTSPVDLKFYPLPCRGTALDRLQLWDMGKFAGVQCLFQIPLDSLRLIQQSCSSTDVMIRIYLLQSITLHSRFCAALRLSLTTTLTPTAGAAAWQRDEWGACIYVVGKAIVSGGWGREECSEHVRCLEV